MKKIAFLFLLATALSAMDTEDMVKNVRVLINDMSISGVAPRYSTSTIVDQLNVVQYETVDLTWCLNYQAKTTLTQGTTYYSLPATGFVPYRVVFGTTMLKIISYNELDTEYPGWQIESGGIPKRYYVAVSTYANSPVVIGIYPVNNGSGVLTVDYVVIPTALTYPDSIPFNGEKRLYTYHSLIPLRVASIINDVRGELELATSQKADYSQLLAAMLKTINVKPGEIPADDPRGK